MSALKHRVQFLLDIFCVINNRVNVDIINDITLFESKLLDDCSKYEVATIGGASLKPKVKGNTNVQIKNDDGNATQVTLENTLYFPDSPVNIIRVASLTDSFADDHGASIIKLHAIHQFFYWNFNKYCKHIVHSAGIIPEISVQRVSPTWNTFVTTLNWFKNHVISIFFLIENIAPVETHHIIPNDDTNDDHLPPPLIPREGINDDFLPPTTPIDINSDLNTEQTHTTNHSTSLISGFTVGGELIYCRDGHVIKVTLISLLINNKINTITYNVKLPNEKIRQVTGEFFQPSN